MATIDDAGARDSHDVTETGSGLFARKATGLVREVSPLSAWIFNCSVSLPAYVLAFAVFWTLGAFPGANVYLAFWLTFALAAVFIIAFGLLSSALPRSGGDYILVSRLVHPALGVVSSFCVTFAVLLSIGAIALAMATVVVGPGLTGVGLISHSDTLLSWGSTVQESNAWKFGLGTGVILLVSGFLAMGWQVASRFQNVCFAVTMFGFFVGGIVLLVAGPSTFTSNFNELARPITGSADTYRTVISEARSQGALVAPGSNASNSIPAMGAFMGFLLFCYWSVNIAGEVRRAKRMTNVYGMLAVALTVTVLLTVYTWLFFHTFGSDFFAAANAVSGTKTWPFAAPPYWVFLTSIAGGSSLLAWFLALTFMPGLFLQLFINLVQPARAIFAYAFDGLLPMKAAGVSRRHRVPTVATVAVIILSEVALASAVFGTGFNTAISVASLMAFVSTTCLGIAAMALPYKSPALWRESASARRVAGVPIVTIAGAVAVAGSVFGIWVYLHYRVGITRPGLYPVYLVVVGGAALLLYYGATVARARQGIKLSRAFAEIPPE